MYLIYQFFTLYSDGMPWSTPQTNVWIISSEHTYFNDATDQLQRFIDSGINPNYLRVLTDSSPAPTDIPTP